MKKTMICALLLWAAATVAQGRERTYEEKCRIAAEYVSDGASAQAKAKAREAEPMAALAVADEYTVMGRAGGGFAIVSNDDACTPVLGYSSTAVFDATQPALRWYLSVASDALASGHVRSAAVPSDCKASAEQTLSTKWSQDAPYWNMCPRDNEGNRCYTGCVATAMAQIMYCYRYPAIGMGEATVKYNGMPYTVNYATAQYDWENMLTSYSGNYDVAQSRAVAQLMYHCGVAAKMDYKTSGSGAYLKDAAEGMAAHFGYITKYYGYKDFPTEDNYDDAKWQSVVYHELSAGRPLLYAGASTKSSYQNPSYHAFVLDGYDSEGRVGVNWGYAGLGDGFFDLAVLPLKGSGVDEEYRYYHEMVVIHHPDDGAIAYDLCPTAIQRPSADDASAGDAPTYGVNGQRVDGQGHGIVIRDGKKYYRK